MEKIKISDKIRLIHGDCLESLKLIPDNYVSSIVVDPPYGLTDDIDVVEVLKCWLNGTLYKHPKKGFMGKDWDSFVPDPLVWKEAYRVLKPGGHILSFAGTRTYDLMALGIRLAGFEIRDQIQWLYGQGFPKSMDISKKIDEKMGHSLAWFGPWLKKERESRGISQKELSEHFLSKNGKITGLVANWELGFYIPNIEQFNKICEILKLPFEKIEKIQGEVIAYGQSGIGNKHEEETGTIWNCKNEKFEIRELVTDQSKQWEGWGTALKPSNEPIVLARKPISEKTVAENVLKWGVGGLNIEVCRIKTGEDLTRDCKGWASSEHEGYKRPNHETAEKQVFGSTTGRWPANLILDEEAAKLLDEQTGVLTSGKPGKRNKEWIGYSHGLKKLEKETGFGDSGGASRFFYIAKASTSEKNRGLDNKESEKVNDGRQTPIDNPFQRGETLRKNTHPTVKPISLIKYLIKLITPNGGVCLDMYNGSGTAGCAIAELNKEGFNFKYIGIDREKEYIDISVSRIDHYLKTDEVKDDVDPTVNQFIEE